MYVSCRVDEKKCNGCKLCIWACPDPNVIVFHPDSKKISIHQTRCKGCGLCVAACRQKALEIEAG